MGGEVVTAGLKQRATAFFGPLTFGEGYAMTEIWPFGGQLCDQGHLHFDPGQGLLEVLDSASGQPSAPGEVGVLVATPFPPYRETTLLLRYNTEDMVQVLAEPCTCALRHLPATGNLLGKRRLATQHEQGWVYPRQILEALEASAAAPLPARWSCWAVPGGVAVAVVVAHPDDATRQQIGAALEAQGVPLRLLELVEQPDQLRQPYPLRCDLRDGDWRKSPCGSLVC